MPLCSAKRYRVVGDVCPCPNDSACLHLSRWNTRTGQHTYNFFQASDALDEDQVDLPPLNLTEDINQHGSAYFNNPTPALTPPPTTTQHQRQQIHSLFDAPITRPSSGTVPLTELVIAPPGILTDFMIEGEGTKGEGCGERAGAPMSGAIPPLTVSPSGDSSMDYTTFFRTTSASATFGLSNPLYVPPNPSPQG